MASSEGRRGCCGRLRPPPSRGESDPSGCADRRVAAGSGRVPTAPVLEDAFLHRDFARALLEADLAIVTDVYGAREEPQPGVSGKLIVESMLELSPRADVAYIPRLSRVDAYLREIVQPGDLVLTMGAGDVHSVGEHFLQK